MHVTLRSGRARGKWSLLQKENRLFVDKTIAQAGRRWGVTVYERANVGNHLHLLLKARTRRGFSNFLRALAGAVAMFVTGAARGKALGVRFWDLSAWSRVVESDFAAVRAYVIQNRLEAAGEIPYRPRCRKALGDRSRADARL